MGWRDVLTVAESERFERLERIRLSAAAAFQSERGKLKQRAEARMRAAKQADRAGTTWRDHLLPLEAKRLLRLEQLRHDAAKAFNAERVLLKSRAQSRKRTAAKTRSDGAADRSHKVN